MRKQESKPDEPASKAAAPLGYMSIPPNAAVFDGGDTYIIITSRQTAERVISEIFDTKNTGTIPQ